MNGYHDREKERDELMGYYIRKVCFYTIAPHRDKNHPIKNERDLWPHPFDKHIEAHRLRQVPMADITFEEPD
jgi:hypothetical protein